MGFVSMCLSCQSQYGELVSMPGLSPCCAFYHHARPQAMPCFDKGAGVQVHNEGDRDRTMLHQKSKFVIGLHQPFECLCVIRFEIRPRLRQRVLRYGIAKLPPQRPRLLQHLNNALVDIKTQMPFALPYLPEDGTSRYRSYASCNALNHL